MTHGRRLRTAGAFLALTAALVCTSVWGEPSKDKGALTPPPVGRVDPARPERLLTEDLPATKFTDRAVITYRTQAGDFLFALQVKPALAEIAARPTDYLVMVDTSASQVRGPLNNARKVTQALVDKLVALKSDSRVAIWTVNTPAASRNLTRGFEKADSAPVKNALKELQEEVPLGDTDLKTGVQKAVEAFDHREGRQRVVVFLGDGMSTHNPITAADRAKLCDQLVAKEITFMSVPLGKSGALEPANLHGLATGTGGLVVRVLPTDVPADMLDRLLKAVATPVLYPKKFELPAAAEFFPVKLPPVRSDAPLLVVGKLKAGDKALKEGQLFAYTLSGVVAGKNVGVPEVAVPLPPPDLDNFFLKVMIDQWAQGDRREFASPFVADRALAMTFERTRLAREELLNQGQWAIEQNQFDVAGKLFAEAKLVDPADGQAIAGAKIADLLQKGKMTKKDLRKQLAMAGDDPKLRNDKLLQLALADGDDKPAEKVPAPAPAVPGRDDQIERQKRLMSIEEQHLSEVVTEVEREARRILATDPDRAHEILKRTLASIRDNADLGDRAKTNLQNRLENSLRTVDTDGVRVKRDLEQRMRLAADARRRINQDENRARGEEQIQRRIGEFNNLMAKGREDLAHDEAVLMQQDAIARGASVVPAMVAASGMSLTANNLREVQEIKRVNEERYLLAMLQVDKSHIPFPDEPPVQFPPAATWRKINDLRKGLYDAIGLGEDSPKQALAMQKELDKPYNFEKGIDAGTPFGGAGGAVDILNDRYNLNLWINEKAFKQLDPAFNVVEQQVTLQKMAKVSMSTVLRLLCDQVRMENGYKATYLIRKDLIEITTTYHAAAEKVVRAYPVADLVIAIPNSVNQQALNQSLNALGQYQQIQNPTGLPPGAFGVGGFPAGGFPAGGFPAGGFPAGGFPAGGFPAGGANAGVAGINQGFQGPNVGNNQFGNLGGQFGLQGADTSRQLLELIQDVVGQKGEWRPLRRDSNPMAAPRPFGAEADPADAGNLLPEELLNSLGYYSPARALIIRGSSKIHTRPGGETNIRGPGANPVGAAPGKRDPGVAIAADPKDPKDAKDPKGKLRDIDPKTAWQEALAKGVKNPRAIVECADFLIDHRQFAHAVEFLKAALREGVVDQPWAFEALAVSLQMTDASADEVERAVASSVDLQPTDAQAYLKAARSLAELKNHKQALAYCRQAAVLQPNDSDSYSSAVAYAHESKDGEAMAWAASRLLAQDWPLENESLHVTAQQKLEDLAKLLKTEKRQGESEQMLASVRQSRERDLVIRLTWKGDADLDLKVQEPIGTVCSAQQRQTPGGGTLMGDTLSDNTTETYVAAQAYAGAYEVTVLRAWGRPLGGKATIEVVRHQGTPQEKIERHVLAIDATNTLRVTLEDGRRTEAATVPPPSVNQKDDADAPATTSVAAQLRMMTTPVVFGDVGIRGGFSGETAKPKAERPAVKSAAPSTPVAQNKVTSFVSNALEMTTQTTVTSEGLRVRLNPVFQGVGRGTGPVVNNPVVPGSN